MVDLKYIVKDNFLPKDIYLNLREKLYSSEIPWYYRRNDVKGNPDSIGFFNFCWFNDGKIQHPSFEPDIVPILKMMNCYSVFQVRANHVLTSHKNIKSSWHVDSLETNPNYKTAILMFTTCNAITQLDLNNEIIGIESIENRLILFDGNIKHMVKYQTNVPRRIVINFNFIQNDN